MSLLLSKYPFIKCPYSNVEHSQIPKILLGTPISVLRDALNARLRRLRTLLTNNKHTKLIVKILMFKTLLKSVWAYCLQLYSTVKMSNVNKIKQFRNIVLRKITNAPPFISNSTLHKSLTMKAAHFYKCLHNFFQTHRNPSIIPKLY